LNRTGARLYSLNPLRVGEPVTVALMADDGSGGALEARIVWAARDDKGEYNAGVAFRNLSPDKEYLMDLRLLRRARLERWIELL
jgi:hypothetical protein